MDSSADSCKFFFEKAGQQNDSRIREKPKIMFSLFQGSFQSGSATGLLGSQSSFYSCQHLRTFFEGNFYVKMEEYLFLPWPEVSVSLLGASLHHSDNLSNLTTRGSSWFLQAIIVAAVIQHCDGVQSQSDKEILQFSESHDRVNVEALPEVLSKRDMVAVPSLCK